jgi:hypothetical protein
LLVSQPLGRSSEAGKDVTAGAEAAVRPLSAPGRWIVFSERANRRPDQLADLFRLAYRDAIWIYVGLQVSDGLVSALRIRKERHESAVAPSGVATSTSSGLAGEQTRPACSYPHPRQASGDPSTLSTQVGGETDDVPATAAVDEAGG